VPLAEVECLVWVIFQNLVVNANSNLASTILNSSEDAQKDLVKQALDLAKLSQGLLKGEELTSFVKRNFETLT